MAKRYPQGFKDEVVQWFYANRIELGKSVKWKAAEHFGVAYGTVCRWVSLSELEPEVVYAQGAEATQWIEKLVGKGISRTNAEAAVKRLSIEELQNRTELFDEVVLRNFPESLELYRERLFKY